MTAVKKNSFDELGLSRRVLDMVQELGFEEPTPVQQQAIPVILGGANVLAQAPTGTGKTLAFGLPLMDMLDRKKKPSALILVPTRELCIQVAQELNKVGMKLGVFALPVYGGQSIEGQKSALRKGVHIVVGTPGRLIDHLERGTLKLDDIGCVVLDEADEMLDMGFLDDIERILSRVPEGGRRMLFSATLPPQIMAIARRYMRDHEKISLSRESIVLPTIRQIFYEVRENDKLDVLTRVLDTESGDLVLIFCHTKKETDDVAYALKSRGYPAEPLHGDYSQTMRERVMDKFRKKKITILVATDVAARGLDITGVSHVINYSIPQNPESYVHRIGRTGRAGREGVAITFATPREYRWIQQIERATKSRIKKTAAPDLAELIEAKKANFIARIREAVGRSRKRIAGLRDGFTEAVGDGDTLDFLIASFIVSAGLEPEDARPDVRAAQPAGTMKRLLVTAGRRDGIEPRDIFRALVEKAGIRSDEIGRIRIQDTVTVVEVSDDAAATVLAALDTLVLKGRPARVVNERAGDRPEKEKSYGGRKKTNYRRES